MDEAILFKATSSPFPNDSLLTSTVPSSFEEKWENGYSCFSKGQVGMGTLAGF
jgi:hypothetical protein